MKESGKKIDRLLLQVVNIEKIDLKFIFDHIRNYGIASSVMALGIYLGKHPQPLIDNLNFSFDIIWAIVLVFIGFVLNILNFFQIALFLAKANIKLIPYIFISFLLFMISNKIFISLFFKQVLS